MSTRDELCRLSVLLREARARRDPIGAAACRGWIDRLLDVMLGLRDA